MARLTELLRRLRELTAAPTDEVERLRARLLDEIEQDDPRALDLLRGVGAPSPAAFERVRDRLTVPRRARRPAVGLLAPVGAVALAAAALLVVGRATVPAASTAPLPLALDTKATAEVRPAEHVRLEVDGLGRASGSDGHPRIAWERGHLGVEVDPGEGVDLVVSTPEAQVRVVGTVFSVDRDPLGTRVAVSRGKVEVRCGEEPPTFLVAGEEHLCWPVDRVGLLARARTLRTLGTPAEDVLATVDRALAIPGDDPLRGELLAQRTRACLDAGRREDALATARRYLDEGHAPRREELLALVGELSAEAADGNGSRP